MAVGDHLRTRLILGALLALTLAALAGAMRIAAPSPSGGTAAACTESESSPGPGCAPAAMLQALYECDGPYARLTFGWLPSADGRQWLDLSVGSHFGPGSFVSAGPLEKDAGSHRWERVIANTEHFYRVNTLTPEGWLVSDTGSFVAACEHVSTLPCGDILAPLDKQHRLPADCTAADLVPLPTTLAASGQYLRAEAAGALLRMFGEASRDGVSLYVASSYRSYQTQEAVFAAAVERQGVEQASRVSARPGHSEHQLGTTADVSTARAGFGLTRALAEVPEGQWLAENAWRFGFVISYPEGKEHITGYAFEPWHIRYVGQEVAVAVRESGLTLHEFLLLAWYAAP